MATFYITEFNQLAVAFNPRGLETMPAPLAASITAEQSVAITGASATSSAFNPKTVFILVNTDVACSIAFGSTASPAVAVTTAHRLSANESRFYGVAGNNNIAVIANT